MGEQDGGAGLARSLAEHRRLRGRGRGLPRGRGQRVHHRPTAPRPAGGPGARGRGGPSAPPPGQRLAPRPAGGTARRFATIPGAPSCRLPDVTGEPPRTASGARAASRVAAVLGMVALATTAARLPSAGAAGPAPPDTVVLEELTWTEVRDLIRAGKTTIIVPTGGTEQNGPHMALGKHNRRVGVNAEAIARRLGNALVAPVLAYVPEGSVDPPTGHMRYAGTITLPDPWFEKVLEFAARSFKAHGFRDIVFIGDSGENQPGQQAVAARLNRQWARTAVRVHAIEAYYRATAALRDRLRADGVPEKDLDGHAALID